MEVIHPALQKPVPVVGVMAIYLMPKRLKYVTVSGVDKHIVLTPKDHDVTVALTPGAAEGVVVAGSLVTVTFVQGLSTPASLQAVVGADPVAKDLLSISGDTDVIPITYPGTSGVQLFETRPIPPVLMNIVDGDGNIVPFSGKSISIAVTVPADRDNAYDCVKVDLNVDRTGGAEITKGGASLAGRNLAVVSTDDSFILRFNSNTNDDIPQTPTDHGSFENTEFSKVFLDHPPLGAGKFAYLYVGRKV